MKLEKITALLHEVDRTGVTEFEVQDGDFRLSIRKTTAAADGENTCQTVSGAVSPQEAPREQEAVSIQEGTIIRSPLVGIFHASDSQSTEPLVTVGSRVEQGQVMGAIEAMKMMNDVVAGCDGTVSEVLVKDGDLVEYAQPLFVIEG